MTPAPPGPDGMRPELLAAYADGELEPAARAAVERWLAEHPHARAELAAQHQLSPANWRFWQHAEPALPSAAAWDDVGNRIAEALAAPLEPAVERAPRRGLRIAAALAALAAAVAIAGFALQPPVATAPTNDVARRAPVDVPPQDWEPFPMAGEADVEIQRVAAVDRGALPVGEVPLGGALVLAAEEDVAVEGVEDHPHWPSGGPVVVPNPGDAPMIYATRPR